MTLADDTRGFEHRFIEVNSIKLHVVVGGSGPLILLLHGWPELWATWRHVLQPLTAAGFTVAAPDLRGFNLSDKPAGVAAYALDHVVADIADLVRALGFPKAHVVGHDWGGAAAWHLAHTRDDVLDRAVIVNAPHPLLFKKRLLRSPSQLRRAYYMFLFQLPDLPERLLSLRSYGALRNIMRHQPRRPGAFDDEDVRVYVEAMAQPGALTASLNYYRAALRVRERHGTFKPKIERPVLILWGMDDLVLMPQNLAGLDVVAHDVRVVQLEGCSHWVQHDAPERLVEETLRFLR